MTNIPLTDQAFLERASRARSFLTECEYDLGVAMVDHTLGDANGTAVVDALMAYRNDDGGFGHGLEVDIAAPESNPFATRLAMQVLLSMRDDAAAPILPSLQNWLITNQSPDGDWHLSEATRSDDLAPWFAAWEHPSLNPSCCITGLANRLGIATPQMLERTATLFAEKASIEHVSTGSFYELLPYSEYLTAVADIPERDVWLDAFATRIVSAGDEIYADAGHFWEQVLALGKPIVERLPEPVLASWANRLLEEQSEDGGWPSPYSPAWRPWITATSVGILAHLADPSDR